MSNYPKYNDISGTGAFFTRRVTPAEELENELNSRRNDYRRWAYLQNYRNNVVPRDVRDPDTYGLSRTDANTDIIEERQERHNRALDAYDARMRELSRNRQNPLRRR